MARLEIPATQDLQDVVRVLEQTNFVLDQEEDIKDDIAPPPATRGLSLQLANGNTLAAHDGNGLLYNKIRVIPPVSTQTDFALHDGNSLIFGRNTISSDVSNVSINFSNSSALLAVIMPEERDNLIGFDRDNILYFRRYNNINRAVTTRLQSLNSVFAAGIGLLPIDYRETPHASFNAIPAQREENSDITVHLLAAYLRRRTVADPTVPGFTIVNEQIIELFAGQEELDAQIISQLNMEFSLFDVPLIFNADLLSGQWSFARITPPFNNRVYRLTRFVSELTSDVGTPFEFAPGSVNAFGGIIYSELNETTNIRIRRRRLITDRLGSLRIITTENNPAALDIIALYVEGSQLILRFSAPGIGDSLPDYLTSISVGNLTVNFEDEFIDNTDGAHTITMRWNPPPGESFVAAFGEFLDERNFILHGAP